MIKKSKSSVDFTYKAAIHDERCGLCQYFIRIDRECRLVQGDIPAAGWCRLFERKGR